MLEIMQNEIWKDINGYKGLYKISNTGNVLNLKTNEYVKKYGSKKRYYTVDLQNRKRKTFSIHRLVALAFIPNPENKPQIDHIDGDKENNNVENLRWVTAKENNNNPITKQRFKQNNAKNMKGKTGVLHPNSKPVIMLKNGISIKKYQSINLAKKDGFNDTLIIRCCKGKMKTHKGYNWRYD